MKVEFTIAGKTYTVRTQENAGGYYEPVVTWESLCGTCFLTILGIAQDKPADAFYYGCYVLLDMISGGKSCENRTL